jgi:beta-lactam-binding protein with PASTA domain
VTFAQAVAQLAAFGVNAGALSYAFDSSQAGTVLTNITPYLSSNYAGQYVALTLSQGLAPATVKALVPNVVGKFYYDALLALGNARLLVLPPTWVISATILPQYVISQSIAAGSQVAEQTQVSIVVSGFSVTNQGVGPVPVP